MSVDQEPLSVQHVSKHTSDVCTLVNVLSDNTYKMHLHNTSYNMMSEPSSSSQSTRLLSTISESNDAISSPVWENSPGSLYSTRLCDVLQDVFTWNVQTGVHISVFSEYSHSLPLGSGSYSNFWSWFGREFAKIWQWGSVAYLSFLTPRSSNQWHQRHLS